MEGYFTFQWGWFVFQMRGPQLQVGKGRIPNNRGIGFGRAGGGGREYYLHNQLFSNYIRDIRDIFKH